MIELQKLSKNFKVGNKSLEILHKINLTIQNGEFISLIGQSGSGKSTLLHLIAGFIKPSNGKVLIDGNNLAELDDEKTSAWRNEHLGFVFQDFNLLNHLSLEENIILPSLIKAKNQQKKTAKNLEKAKISQTENLKKLLAEVDLLHRSHHKPPQVSGGQKQRAALARALINQPQILLADEPTGNLDAQTGKKIIELIKKLHSEHKITVIIATHDKQIASYADRIIEINEGEIGKISHFEQFTS